MPTRLCEISRATVVTRLLTPLVLMGASSCSLLFPLDGYAGPGDASPDVNLDVDLGIHCGQTNNCVVGQQLCCSYGTTSNDCVAIAAGCDGGNARLCDDNNDCRVDGGTQSCCGMFDGGVTSTTCEDSCPGGTYVVCNDTFNACPGGTSCTGGHYGRCQ